MRLSLKLSTKDAGSLLSIATTALALVCVTPTVGYAAEKLLLDFEKSVQLAYKVDRRISEKEKLVGVARGLLQEAHGASSWIYDFNTFLGLSPQVKSGNLVNDQGAVDASALDFDGVSPWYNLEFTIVHPLATFGKIDNYTTAAENNIAVKKGDVELQRAETYLNVATAYYGYLAARDSHAMLDDAREKINTARELIEGWLEEDTGKAKQADLFALETGLALVDRFQAEAIGFENIAMAGLRMLTGVSKDTEIEFSEKRINPLPLPKQSLEELQATALKNRPEMTQVEAGLRARRALVAANKAEAYPNLYAGIGGIAAYSPLRETPDLNVYDPYNGGGATPVIGLKWDWYSGRQRAKVTQAQAELDALLEKKSFALAGIPFQVAEAYHHVQAHHEMVQKLYKGARSGRRWLISSYADFEAGVEDSDKVVSAFQGYLMVYGEYLQKVNDFNLHIAKLRIATGEVK